MKKSILCTILLFSSVGATSLQAEPENEKSSIQWEYKVSRNVHYTPDKGNTSIEEGMNHLGSLGWELVTVTPMGNGEYRYIFKRIKN